MLLLTALVFSLHVTSGFCGLATAWENFWSTSCEFSTMVSRSRRSVPEPDVKNPEQLFEYLYPLADTKVDDLLKSSGRSSDVHPHSLSNWLDDLVDLWQSECHDRHRRSVGQGREEGRSASGWNMFRRNATYSDSDNSEDAENGEQQGEGEGEETEESKDGSSSDSKDKADAGSSSAAPAVKDDDTFFAAYGGDIEYFFPLISFGIPFDGEISLLGFHGFKGLFPYK